MFVYQKTLSCLPIIKTTQITFFANNFNTWRDINISYFKNFIFNF